MGWRECWEDDADAELRALTALPLAALLRRVDAGKLSEHHVIWDAIAAKQDLPACGWRLYDFLTSPAPYLSRYHCARVLLALLGCTKFDAAALTVAHLNPAAALAEMSGLLERAIGPRQSMR
jgi:hypothetical protein